MAGVTCKYTCIHPSGADTSSSYRIDRILFMAGNASQTRIVFHNANTTLSSPSATTTNLLSLLLFYCSAFLWLALVNLWKPRITCEKKSRARKTPLGRTISCEKKTVRFCKSYTLRAPAGQFRARKSHLGPPIPCEKITPRPANPMRENHPWGRQFRARKCPPGPGNSVRENHPWARQFRAGKLPLASPNPTLSTTCEPCQGKPAWIVRPSLRSRLNKRLQRKQCNS